ncbi:MAG: type II toxin-antitoxin system RelE/ParE family toxin [Phycisphaerales bacterium JB063]
MAREIVWHAGALGDLESIWQHIARDSESYASAIAARIVSATELLLENPLIGHRLEQVLRTDVREISVYPYRVFYAVSDRSIDVLIVAHGARDLNDGFFNRRLP